ncbi:radical SAM protein [Methylomagnum sp.]
MLKRLFLPFIKRQKQAVETPAVPSGVPNPGVRIVDGKIIPNYACQTEIVNHCNLSCRDCNHISPLAKKGFADPEILYRDFAVLAKVYKPLLVYLTGGEPLLHPNIDEVIKAVRASGISGRIRVLTNGLLLPRMKEEFWESIDELEISIYPGANISQELLERYKDKAKASNVILEIYNFNEFRRSFSINGTTDSALVERIYRACKAAHVWGCHYLQNGYIYKCPQSIFIPRMLHLPEQEHTRDGIKLRDAPDFRDELYAYLTAPNPLQACRNCLATAGVQRPHTLVRPKDWLSEQEGSMASIVDYEELARIEAEMHIQKPDNIKALIMYQDAHSPNN